MALLPTAALAVPPNVQITNLTTEVESGSSSTMRFTVADANNGQGQGGAAAQIRVAVNGGMSCQGDDCSRITRVDNDGEEFEVRLIAPTVAAGQTRNATVQITAIINGESSNASQTVTIQGPDRPETVTQVSGKVRDQNNKAVAGADVAMKDSQGNAYAATTNGSGAYSFRSTDANPIAPGNIRVAAQKGGYEAATVDVQGTSGKSVTAQLTLKLVAATTSPTPSASVSAEASAEAVDDLTEETADAAPPPADAEPASNDSGSGSLLFIVLGGLLVAAGVGAIVLVVMRRKNAADDGLGDDDPSVMGAGPGMIPPSQGRFNDATRVAAPMGNGADATMVAPHAGGSLADAATMIHRPVPDDEFPDPYGAPIPQQGGYRGAAAGGWDDGGGQYGGGNGYSEPTQYGRPRDGAYGAGAAAGAGAAQGGGGYGPDRRYDEPTGMYRPADDYDDYDRGRGYGAGGGAQYGGGGGRDAGVRDGGYPVGGYDRDDQGGGYGPQQGGGSYGRGGAYDDGYDDRAGYDQRPPRGGGTYGRGGGYDEGGYADQDGYDQRGGRPRQQEPSRPGQRRSLDWMDN